MIFLRLQIFWKKIARSVHFAIIKCHFWKFFCILLSFLKYVKTFIKAVEFEASEFFQHDWNSPFVTRADAFLMLRKKHPEITSEVWDLPNGMLGNAESIASGAKRIAQETLALDLKKFSILSIADPIESTGFGYSIGILVECMSACY